MRSYIGVATLVFGLFGVVVTPALAQDILPEEGRGFVDIEENPHKADILYIVRRGLTVGCDLDGPRYCPGDPVTRAQMATFLVRAVRRNAGCIGSVR